MAGRSSRKRSYERNRPAEGWRVCVCVCVCARARVRVRVRMRVRMSVYEREREGRGRGGEREREIWESEASGREKDAKEQDAGSGRSVYYRLDYPGRATIILYKWKAALNRAIQRRRIGWNILQRRRNPVVVVSDRRGGIL